MAQFYCGLACLVSLVKFYGGETTQEKLRENSGTTLNGTSLLGLYQAAQKLGFEVAGYEAEIKNLIKPFFYTSGFDASNLYFKVRKFFSLSTHDHQF